MAFFKIFKKTTLSGLVADALYFIKGGSDTTAKAYITNSSGAAIPVKNTVGDIVAGGAISVSGNLSTGNTTIAHSDTSSQASISNSNGTVIQSITLDTYGHLSGATSTDLDARYFSLTGGNAILANDRRIGTGTTGANPYVYFNGSGAMAINIATGESLNFTINSSTNASVTSSGVTSFNGLRTQDADSSGLSPKFWRFGDSLSGGGGTPDSRLQVRVGDVLFEIPAFYIGPV